MSGSKVPRDPTISPELRRFLDERSRAIDEAIADAVSASQTEFISGLIKLPVNQDYRIVEKIPHGATLSEFTAKLASGTCTATLKIGTTAVTGGAINATSSQQSSSLTAANTAAVGDVLVITISLASSPVDLSFAIKYTKTLAT
jgi:hypothetical protein